MEGTNKRGDLHSNMERFWLNKFSGHHPEDYINLHLRIILLSGDWISLALPGKIKKHFPTAAIISLGGAIEASIWSIHYPIKNGEVEAAPVSTIDNKPPQTQAMDKGKIRIKQIRKKDR